MKNRNISDDRIVVARAPDELYEAFESISLKSCHSKVVSNIAKEWWWSWFRSFTDLDFLHAHWSSTQCFQRSSWARISLDDQWCWQRKRRHSGHVKHIMRRSLKFKQRILQLVWLRLSRPIFHFPLSCQLQYYHRHLLHHWFRLVDTFKNSKHLCVKVSVAVDTIWTSRYPDTASKSQKNLQLWPIHLLAQALTMF